MCLTVPRVNSVPSRLDRHMLIPFPDRGLGRLQPDLIRGTSLIARRGDDLTESLTGWPAHTVPFGDLARQSVAKSGELPNPFVDCGKMTSSEVEHIGGYLFRLEFNPVNPAAARGAFTFNGQWTGNAFADFLLGQVRPPFRGL